MGHGVRGMWYEIRGTWCRVHGTGHSRAQMNNKDIIFVHMAYSRLDWNPPARGVAGGGCKISPEVIFTTATTTKSRMRSRFVHTCMLYIHRLDWSSPARWGAGELNTPVLLLFLILI